MINIKAEIKKEIIEYYENIKYDIDLRGQELLVLQKANNDLIVENYLNLINKIDTICDLNLNEINSFFQTTNDENDILTKNEILFQSLSTYGIYFKHDQLKENAKNDLDKTGLGSLVIFKGLLNDDQSEYLKCLIGNHKSKNLINFDQDILYLSTVFGIIKQFNHNCIEVDKEMNMYLIKDHLDLTINFPNCLSIENNTFKSMGQNLTGLKSTRFSQIFTLKSNCFYNLSNMKDLNLESVQLRQIDKDVFANLPNLESLNLSYNNLQFLESNTFNGLNNLKKLILRSAIKESIHSNAFNQLLNLEYIDLSYNYGLRQLDVNLFNNLFKLIHLNLSDNSFEILKHETFKSLTNLKVFHLNSFECDRIEENPFNYLLNLEILNIDIQNYVNYFQFKNDIKLDKLSIKKWNVKFSNRLNLVNLKTLDLSHNVLKTIKNDYFKHMPNLVDLDLSYCEIKQIEAKAFKKLINLEKLNLRGNSFMNKSIMKSSRFDFLIRLTSVRMLNMSNCKIKTIDLRYFQNLTHLIELDLSRNQFTTRLNFNNLSLRNQSAIILL